MTTSTSNLRRSRPNAMEQRCRAAAAGTAAVTAACLAAVLTLPAQAGPTPGGGPAPAAAAPGTPHAAGSAASRPILALVAEGRWGRACEAAAGALARSEPDLDALGLFGICAAAANDRTAAGAALSRLREVEPAPAFHARIVRGILELQDKAPDRARAHFDAALALRPGDALATYFVGESQHAARQDAKAIESFQAVLRRWPRFVPALAGAARLMAAPGAPQSQLVAARALAERATGVEPTNTSHWKLLADLCERTGQQGRAEAIRLQWLADRGDAALAGGSRAASR